MHNWNKIVVLSKGIAVGPLATPKTVRLAKTIGFMSIVDTMPCKSAGASDIVNKEIEHCVRNSMLDYRQFGIDDIYAIKPMQIHQFTDLLATLPKPIFLFPAQGSA